MKRWSLLAGVMAALVAAMLTVGPVGASAEKVKTPTATASIRVSSNCTVTISGHWSHLVRPASQIHSGVDDSTYDYGNDTAITGVRHGNFKDVYTATPSTTPTTLVGEVSVYSMMDGWIVADSVSTTAYCSGPFSLVTKD